MKDVHEQPGENFRYSVVGISDDVLGSDDCEGVDLKADNVVTTANISPVNTDDFRVKTKAASAEFISTKITDVEEVTARDLLNKNGNLKSISAKCIGIDPTAAKVVNGVSTEVKLKVLETTNVNSADSYNITDNRKVASAGVMHLGRTNMYTIPTHPQLSNIYSIGNTPLAVNAAITTNAKHTRSQDYTNCIVCATRPSIIFSTLLATTTLCGRCPHDGDHWTRQHFHISKVKTAWSCLFSAIFAACAACYVHAIWTSHADKISKLQLATELLQCLKTMIFIGSFLLKCKVRMHELNGWAVLLDRCELYGVCVVLSSDVVTSIRGTGRRYFTWMLAALVALTVAAWTMGEMRVGTWFLARKIVCMICMLEHLIITFQISVEAITFQAIVRRYQTLVASFLNARCPRLTAFDYTPDTREIALSRLSTEDQLKCLSRLYIACNLNLNYINKFLSPSLLITFVCSLAILIINIYILIKERNLHYSYDMAILEVEALCTIAGMVYFFKIVDDCHQVNDYLLSFLHRYPISKLNKGESAQVEVIIGLLNSRKPTLKASQIFFISMSLLSSVSGTVVTYVLVALQFRTSWDK